MMAGSSQHHVIPIEGSNIELLNSIMKVGNKKVNTSHSNGKPRIQKVPKMLREIEKNRKCYDPMVVSIGPYHHGNLDLNLMENLKIPAARQLVLDSGSNIEELYSKVEECNASKYYVADSTTDAFKDDKKFKSIMFLDGCFVLHFIDCIMNGKQEELKMKNDHIAFVTRDLFLLENQLPFILLKELMSMSLRFHGDVGKKMINGFIERQTRIEDSSPWQEEPFHLLDLLRTQLLGPAGFTQQRPSDGTKPLKYRDWHSFRSANELKAVGVKCVQSKGNSFKDIGFKYGRFYGYLSLPQIVIDDSTKPKLLNLVAYEACPAGSPRDFGVATFICFLDSLIDSAADVKELRSKKILLNVLGSDEQVADLFNDLTIDLVPDPSIYQKVKDSIEEHYTKDRRIWMAQVLYTHFSSPWTIIGFAAAVSVFILTFIQTFFTIRPR